MAVRVKLFPVISRLKNACKLSNSSVLAGDKGKWGDIGSAKELEYIRKQEQGQLEKLRRKSVGDIEAFEKRIQKIKSDIAESQEELTRLEQEWIKKQHSAQKPKESGK